MCVHPRHMCTNTKIYIHTYTHLHTCTNTKEYVCTHHTYTHSQTQRNMHEHTTHLHIHKHKGIYVHTPHTYTHTQIQRNTRSHTIHLQIKKVFYKKMKYEPFRTNHIIYRLNIILKIYISKTNPFPIALEEKNLYNQHQSISLCSVLF